MIFDDTKIKDILLREDYLSEEDAKLAEKEAEKTHTPLVEYLLSNGFITKNLLGQAIAESFGVKFIDLEAHPPTPQQVKIIPEDFARKYTILLTAASKTAVAIATHNPTQPGIKEDLAKRFPKHEVQLNFAFEDDIHSAFIHYKKSLETRFSEVIKEQKRVAPEIIEEIFIDATTFQASDIHFEPGPKNAVIRFRIDGVMHEAGRVAKDQYENIVNRIKVLSHLRIDEHFSVQDGAMQITTDNGTSDVRISIAPTVDGEKVVLRLLSSYVRDFTLDDLGISQSHQEQLKEASKKPFGMILVTGPTGSGKTTTLYALLKKINSPEINITTIEDPVEYKITGVNHIQVAPEKDITFAQGLRSIVRQDPDVILVGEIRDRETADIATNAALTGHLLFSTFHANDSATAIPRLLDMGVEPFLMASTLEMIVAQRLVRKICGECRYSYTLSPVDAKKQYPKVASFLPNTQMTLYKGKGCKSCSNTGYRGRIAVLEIIVATPELKELILKHPSTQEIWKMAASQGSTSLFEDGMNKVKHGTTTLDEVLRVINPK